MDPQSKVDYSWHIREMSMPMEKLSEVNPPSGRVPGQRILEALTLKRRRGQNREGIMKKGLLPRVSMTGCKYRRKGAARGATRDPGVPWARPHPWSCHQGAWGPGGSLWLPLDDSGSSWCTGFLYDFP